MKKALVLGVLAFFAINIASVQSVSAQDRKATPTSTVKKEAKPAGVKKEAKQTAKTAANATTATATEPKTVKPSAAASNKATVGKETKSCCKEDGKQNGQTLGTASQNVDPTAKNKKATPEIGVPPTPQNTAKKSTAKSTKGNSNANQR